MFKDLFSECKWIRDTGKRLMRPTCSIYNNCPITQFASNYTFIDTYALNFIKIHFHRMSTNHTPFCNNSTIGNCKFCRRIVRVSPTKTN